MDWTAEELLSKSQADLDKSELSLLEQATNVAHFFPLASVTLMLFQQIEHCLTPSQPRFLSEDFAYRLKSIFYEQNPFLPELCLRKLRSSIKHCSKAAEQAYLRDKQDTAVTVFDDHSSEEPFKLEIEDVVGLDGQIVYEAWTHNVKVAIYIRTSFK